MNYFERGLTLALSGLRRGSQSSLYSGAVLLAYAAWRRSKRRRLLYRRILKADESLLVRASRRGRPRLVVDGELAERVRSRRRDEVPTQVP